MVSNGLCEHLRSCEQCVYFCEHEQWSTLSCEKRVLKKSQMAISEHFSKFSASWNLSLWKRCFASSNLAVTPSKQDNRRKARQHVKILSRFNHSQQLTANYALFSIPFTARNYFTWLHKSHIGSFSRGLKIACLYKRNVSGRVTLLPGTELRPVSFNKRQQNEEAFFQKHKWWAHVAPMLKNWETLFPVSVFVSKMQIMLMLHSREF